MSPSASIPGPPSSAGEIDPATGQKFWSVGTLRYTKGGLLILFFWLLGNDLCLMLMEQVAPQITPLLIKDHGGSNKDIALFISTLGSFLNIWINPIVSTWSDRHRGPWGRRRPFLLFAAPVAAVLLSSIPFMPSFAAFLGLSPTSGAVLLIGVCYLCYAVFNSVILAIFMYYFWDVVPEPLLGRFSAMTKVISLIATFLWNYYLFGLAEKHAEIIFISVAVFFLTVYLLSLWQVKEGEYPPPDPHRKGGLPAPIRAYFLECYTHSYYLWVFGAMAAYQLGGIVVIYQIFYFRDTLGLDLDHIGKMRAWAALPVALLAYPLGVAIDRLKPIRLVAPSLIFWSLVNLFAFFFLRDQTTLFVYACLIGLANFLFGVAFGVMNVEVFPREKLGQFCSANTITYQIIIFFVAVPVGKLFDYLNDYRYVFLWSAVFQIAASLLFLKVYFNWKRRGGAPPPVRAG